MGRLGIRNTPVAALAAFLASCSAGFQGGTVPEKFNGISAFEAISPESIQLSWENYPGATQYRLYSSETNNALAQPQFKSIILKPNIATAATTKYSVTAVDPNTGLEMGSRSNYIGPVTLLPRFNFKSQGTIAPVEAAGVNGTRLKVSWTGYAKVTYRVYLGERSPDGIVNYNGFTASSATSLGGSSVVINNLLPGREYCAVMIADYTDNTKDGPDGTPFTTEITSTLNGWKVGTSGDFGDSKIALSQRCARTSSGLVVDRVKIYSQKAFLSTRPVFYVYDSDHPNENDPASGFEAAVYQVNNTTGLASYVGKTNGSGQIIALSDLAPGRYKFYAMVTSTAGATMGSMAKKELIVGTDTGEPEEANRKWIYIRGIPDLETSNPGTQAYYPEKQQDSLGSQRLGSSVATGDFDCDGKYDIAIGVPMATETSVRDSRSAQGGKVVVYYDVDDSIGPNVTTRSKIITFDITPYDQGGRDLQLGTSLLAGNFNKDNQRTNQNNPSGEPTFQCHDLVIGSGYGPMFVVYGKRNVTGFDGGLNYTGATGYAVNPSSSCDTSGNVCSPAVYTLGAFNNKVGVSMAIGNFNGSGFEDLVATTYNVTTSANSGTLVFRGSENGLIPPSPWTGMRTTAQGCPEDYATYPYPDGPKKGYPYLPSDSRCFYAPNGALVNGWGEDSFGRSVAAFPNAYFDLNGNGSGTRRMRDVLLIGNPDHTGPSTFAAGVQTKGRIYVCRPTTSQTAVASLSPALDFDNSMTTYDMNNYFAWACGYNTSISNSVIDSPLNGVGTASGTDITGGDAPLGTSFGSAMIGIRNALLYDRTKLSSNGNTSSTSTDIGYPGALAVGAYESSKVFLYYQVQFPEGTNASSVAGVADRTMLGNARNNHFNALIAGTRAGGVSGSLATVTEHPCRLVNSSGIIQNSFSTNTAYREKCDVQVMSPPGGANWSNYSYGRTLFSVMGSNAISGSVEKQSILAVPAPNRNIASSGSVVFSALGSVQLYYQNVVSETNGYPIRTKTIDSTCDYCRFSDGFANAGSSSIDFDGTKRDNVQFGAGGVASGPVKAGSASSYNSNADVVIGVPGYVLQRNAASVIDSGAGQVSFSHGGQFRSYQVDGNIGTNSPWHFIDTSYGQESDIRFFQTINMGDIDQDGLDDIAVRVKLGGENRLRIMKGKGNNGAIGFKATAPDFTDFQVQSDKTGGMRIMPVGRVSTSQFPGYLITAKNSIYLYFGGIGGLIQGQPSAYATAGAPRKFTNPGLPNYLTFNDGAVFNGSSDVSGADYGHALAHGDFNGDGYEDVAVGMTTSMNSLLDSVAGTVVNYSGMFLQNKGRVMIFYGGKDNGFQVQPDINGGYPLNNAYFTPYSASNSITPSVNPTAYPAPCRLVSGTWTCDKIQVLYEGPNVSNTLNTLDFGKTLASVPAGACMDANNVSHPVHALLVQTKFKNSTSKIFIYKPQCVIANDSTNQSGLVQDNVNSVSGGITTFKAEIDPTSTTAFGTVISNVNTFGNSMTAAPGIFGASALSGTDAKTHLLLTDSTRKLVMVFPLTSTDCTYDVNGNAVAGTGNCKIYLSNDPVQGYQKINYSSSNVFAGNVGFAATVASIGDVNGDGFSDVAVSSTSLTRPGTPNTSSGAQGGLMIIFGADLARRGLQAFNGATLIEPALNSACYMKSNGATSVSVCNPTLLFASQPDNTRDGSGDMVYLSRDSKLNFGVQNENLGSFMFGVPMRDSRETLPSNRILRGGAFYVLP